MKILAIRGKNLASIAGEFEIDFTIEPLNSAGIFAICGATGAGKSTLLDALCLALFNNTPRTTGTENIKMADVGKEQIQQGDKRQILRRGTTDGYAEVDFLAVNGKSYRAHWHIRRANNRISGKLQPVDWRVYHLDNQQEIASKISESENKLKELTGLTYEQFTRTVLLAQNEFARFLKARKEEKAEVLEKLTGTEIYSIISNTVYTKNAAAKADWKLTSERLSGIHLLSNEEITSLTEKLKQLQHTCSATEQEQEKTARQIEWLTTYNNLLQEESQAKENLSQASEAIEKARPQIERLRQIESVESASPLWHNLYKYTEDIEKQEQLGKTYQASLSTLEQQARQLTEKYNQSYATLQEYTAAYQARQPELQKAQETDIKISQEENSHTECTQTLQATTQKRIAEETALARRQTELAHLQNRQKTLADWFDKNRKHEQMCLNMNLITGFLDSATNALEQKLQKEQQLTELSSQRKQLLSKQENLKAQLTARQKNLDEKLQEKQHIQQQVNAINILALRNIRKELQTRKEYLKESQNALKEILTWQDRIRQKEEQFQIQQTQRENLQQQVKQIDTEHRTAVIQRDTSRQIYEKAQQLANTDISALRRQLVPDTPCPVCGSCQHPAVTHDSSEQPAIDLLKIEYEKYEANCGELQNTIVRLSQDLLHTDQLLLSLEKEIQAGQKECEEYIQNWNKLNSPDFTKPIIEAETAIQLSKEFSEVEEKLNELERQESIYEQANSLLNETIDRIEKEQQIWKELDKQFSQAKEETDKISSEILKEQALCNNLNIQAENALNKLDSIITIDNWRSRWESGQALFRQELSEAAAKWEARQQEQATLQISVTQQQAKITESLHMLEILREQEKETASLLEKRTGTLNKLRRERAVILEGKTITEVEQEYRQKIKNQTEETDLLNTRKQETDTQLQQLRGETKQLTENIEHLKAQQAKNRKQLSEWLENYNSTTSTPLTENNLTELLKVSSDELNSMRQAADKLQRQLTIAETTLQERQKQIRQHLSLSSKPQEHEQLDSLKEKDNLLKQQLEVLRQEQTEISVILRNHEQNSLQAGEVKQTLERQAEVMEQWSKLDDLIGSQSGNKFKEIAQGYTLDILLNYANKQLKELTSRYQLQRVPGELALQIIDHDMCDEIRSVFSLSGGESFLVSLALALGLSSFSSQNHHEENLFIDEGFGTLDTDTLQVVMEALERLRSQGRKVGVISHVHEMAERIPVQIHVYKAGNGKSKVKILS